MGDWGLEIGDMLSSCQLLPLLSGFITLPGYVFTTIYTLEYSFGRCANFGCFVFDDRP